jgi:RNA polymerase sigma factor (sigma-70 family)
MTAAVELTALRDRHGARVARLARRRWGDYRRPAVLDADDLEQEAWLYLLRALSRGQSPPPDDGTGRGQQATWVSRRAGCAMGMHARCRRILVQAARGRPGYLRQPPLPLDDERDGRVGAGHDPARAAEIADSAAAALRYATPGERAAALLCWRDGLTARDAAARLGVARITVAVRLRRVRDRVRDRVRSEMTDPFAAKAIPA